MVSVDTGWDGLAFFGCFSLSRHFRRVKRGGKVGRSVGRAGMQAVRFIRQTGFVCKVV